MMDIVERLREVPVNTTHWVKCHDAADEIERLRGIINDDRLEGAANEIERLREENKKLQLNSKPKEHLSYDNGFGGSPMQYDYNKR